MFAEGYQPLAGLTLGPDGNFYGTTSAGGTGERGPFTFGAGTIFKVTPAGALTVLLQFDTTIHGGAPQGALTLGTDGNLYGLVPGGGPDLAGNLFRITPSGQWSRVYGFPFTGTFPMGTSTYAPPVEVGGRFYVVARDGGPGGYGTIVEVVPNGTPNGVGTIVHAFSGVEGNPRKLTRGADGFLYGMTHPGGAHGSGTLFRVSTGGMFEKLHDFMFPKGTAPDGQLLEASPGLFLGTTTAGGPSGGVVYQLSFLPELISLSPSSAAVGGAGFTLTITGRRFVMGTQVRWNGSARATTFVNSGLVQAIIPAADLAATGSATVTVVNPGIVTGPSNALLFTIGPTVAVDKSSLTFGAVTSGTTFLFQTSAQVVRLTQVGSGSVTWTATSNQPWLQVTPASGSGSANLSIGLTLTNGLPSSGSVNGGITLSFAGA